MHQISVLLYNYLPEKWNDKTLKLEFMNRMLLQMEETKEIVDPETRNLELTRLPNSFFEFSNCELKKISQFYVDKLHEMKQTQIVLIAEYLLCSKSAPFYTHRIIRLLKAHGQLYLDLLQLKKFQCSNRNRLMRIMTKYDRLVGDTTGVTYVETSCAKGKCLSLNDIDIMISDVEANIEFLFLLR